MNFDMDVDSSDDSSDYPRFNVEESSEATHEPDVETIGLPAITAGRIKEVVLALYPILVAAYLATPRTSPNLKAIVRSMPESLQSDALELLRMLEVWPDEEIESPIALLLAMINLAITPSICDHEEARLPLLMMEISEWQSTRLPLHIALREFVDSGLPEREACVPARQDRDV